MAIRSEAPQVVGLGQCALDFLGEIDRYPGIDQKTELLSSTVQGGGPVATALVTLQRLGVYTAIVGRVGDDEFGDRIRQGLHDEGVDCRNLQMITGKVSQHAFITVERGSGRRNIFWHRGSCPPMPPEDVDRSLIRSARVLHLDGLQLEASIVAAGIARPKASSPSSTEAPCAPGWNACCRLSTMPWSASASPRHWPMATAWIRPSSSS